MANRPVFLSTKESDNLVDTQYVEFRWYPGMSISQKQKNIDSLHSAAKEKGSYPLLEISSKSVNNLGTQLSAFALVFEYKNQGRFTVESAFQGSKVFQNGGPYTDLYYEKGKKAKMDIRIKASGSLLSFQFFGTRWPLRPATAFYDWLYLNALSQNQVLADQLMNYRGFTDIEFNPKKSLNCQARSCALYVSLRERNLIDKVLEDKSVFIDLLVKSLTTQPNLF